jgi:hypothetical protein
VLGRHFSLRPDTVGLAQWHRDLAGPRQPEQRAQWRGMRLRRWPRCSASSGDSTGERQWLHRRRPAAVGQRKRPDATAFQCSGGASLAGEDIDESCSWRRDVEGEAWSKRGRQWGRGGAHRGGGGRWRIGGSLVGRHGHKAEEERRGDGVLKRALAREDERERIEGCGGNATGSGGRVTGGATRRRDVGGVGPALR